jgi:rubrerythrin
MQSIQLAAIGAAINIENRSLGFYHAVTLKIHGINTRRVFERLARDGSEHLQLLCNLHYGNKKELVNALNDYNLYSNPYYSSLLKTMTGDTTEIDALRIACEEKQACIECYDAFLDAIREPAIRDIFLKMSDKSKVQIEMIKVEYESVLKMVKQPEQNTYVKSNRRRTRQQFEDGYYLFQAR